LRAPAGSFDAAKGEPRRGGLLRKTRGSCSGYLQYGPPQLLPLRRAIGHWPLAIGHWPLAIGQVKAAPSVGAKHRINYPLVFLRAHGRNFSVFPPIGSGKHYNFAISERARAPLARAHKLHTNGQGRRQERMCRAGRWQGSSAQAHSGPKPLSLSPEPPPGPW